ncbi:hypothetical protein OAU50_02440 [Planctomycetota bacterium]|nr:hypothetical protein [Planctomycetota bacterium]
MKLLLLLLLFLASPLWAIDVRLTGEEKTFTPKELRLEGDTVHWKKGRKERSAALSDFERPSQFLIKKQFTAKKAPAQLELARFALHRGLFDQTRECLKLAQVDESLTDQIKATQAVMSELEADTLMQQAGELLDASKPEEARPLLERVITDFADTLAANDARVLLTTLDRVALEAEARELAKKAKDAQKDADASLAKKRAPIDDWLDVLQEQISTNRTLFKEANKDCLGGKVHLGLPKFENAADSLIGLRKSIEINRHELKYRGQSERADKIDAECETLLVDVYERWGYYLYARASYRMAAEVCNLGLKLNPRDRRLLRLKLDIDDWRQAQD